MSTKTKRISYKNKSQIEKEVKSAQKKLLQIFLGDLEVNRDQPTRSTETSQPTKNPKPKLEAYNKFNDENLNISQTELREKLTAAGLPNLWIPRNILRVEHIPVLASGKLDIQACARLAANP